MFRSKRSSLAKRLLKKRLTSRPVIDPNNEDEWRRQLEPTTATDRPLQEDYCQSSQLESCLQSMLKRLKESQLKSLFRSIDSKGGYVSDCVLFPKDAIKIGRKAVVEPHVLCCQVWRWPHVRHKTDIKPLLWCHCSQTDPIYVCINPYHWTQVCRPGINFLSFLMIFVLINGLRHKLIEFWLFWMSLIVSIEFLSILLSIYLSYAIRFSSDSCL